jgi:DNA-binding HxlR family transcriptional regulator
MLLGSAGDCGGDARSLLVQEVEFARRAIAAMLALREHLAMKGYGQFCPIAKAAELFCERWTPLIIRDLAAGATRFSELHRGVPLMSPTLLSHRLRQLEAEDVVERRPRAKGKGSTYHLTPSGREFAPIVEALGVWGQRWSRRQLADEETDLGLLLWTLESGARPDAFGTARSVVRLDLTDQPPGKRLWWYHNEGGRCELCFKDPGFEVDLYLTCALPVMIYVVRGDLSLTQAVRLGRLDVMGSAAARRALPSWINLSPLAKVKSQRADARLV